MLIINQTEEEERTLSSNWVDIDPADFFLQLFENKSNACQLSKYVAAS